MRIWKRLTKTRYLKMVVTGIIISVISFTAVMIVCYFTKGGVPDTLIDSFYRWCGIEGGATMIIEVADKIWPEKKRRNSDGGSEEETLEP